MSLLPGLAKRLIVNSKWLIVIFLFSIHYSLLTSEAIAAPAPPNPQSCKNPVQTDDLTDNYITHQNGDPPANLKFTESKTGLPNTQISLSRTLSFPVNFSQLQAIFGATNSNYLEGNFQENPHRSFNLLGAASTDFNNYHGPGQKAAPKVMTDQLKAKYVEYIYNKPEIAESANKYADIAGQNPKTIYDMVNTPNFTYPPIPPSWGGDQGVWNQTWGLYWEKIPTAYNEFYEGKLEFRLAEGQEVIQKIKDGQFCPTALARPPIKFIMPDFFRTAATSGQLNQIVVPKAAQSTQNNPILEAFDQTKTALASIIHKCVQLASQNPLAKTLKKITKITFENLTLVKPAFAQEISPNSCIKIPSQGKSGNAPYCALPAGQLQQGDSCPGNVNCTFALTWSKQLTIGQVGQPDGWDECHDADGDPATPELTCTLEVAIWPVFRIPWLAEIWNNTLYSIEEGGVTSPQITGRPGIYSFFTPQSIDPTKSKTASQLLVECADGNNQSCDQLSQLSDDCKELVDRRKDPTLDQSVIQGCLSIVEQLSKSLPGEVGKANVLGSHTGTNQKERFIGATDCSKEFVRGIALKPKALQEALGIKFGCRTNL